MREKLPAPLNETQREFARLCGLGGGARGGPARGKVQELLRVSGQKLNGYAYRLMSEQMSAYPEANPWHVCFAFGLSWGHLAKLDVDFTGAAVGLLEHWNKEDLSVARGFCLERGPAPIEQSLQGARTLFARVTLPAALPATLEQLHRAQERWLSPILTGADRPRYIGSWNATAMFMAALFAQPLLAATQVEPRPTLPPGGPIFAGLRLLHRVSVLSRPPAGSELDDAAFEPGALYENSALLAEVRQGRDDWSLIDVHSGIYTLGTRDPRSGSWT